MKLLTKLHNFAKRKFSCPVCDSRVFRFKWIGEEFLKQFEFSLFPHSVFAFETLNVFGYSCPSCGASDRARLYKLYIDTYVNEIKGKINLLDIAPDPPLAKCLKNIPGVVYRSADITGHNVDDKVDITSMPMYHDGMFDFIMCSHVLEHVSDDMKAMRELFRILKPGGKAIVMVPILLTIDHIDEDEKVTMPEERMTRFGQDDHVRLYSKSGYVNRLVEAGFAVNEYGLDFFGLEAFKKHGIAERSVLYVVEKRQ